MMKGQEFDACDMPFDGYYAPQGERKRRPGGCPFSKHHDHKEGYVPFGENGPMNHGHHHYGFHHHKFGSPQEGHRRPGCGRWGPPEDGHRKGSCGRWGPPEDGHRKGSCGRWGPPKRDGDEPPEHHFHGPPGFRAGHDGRPHDFFGHGAGSQHFGAHPWWFGRRGPAESQERPWFGPWGGPDQRRS